MWYALIANLAVVGLVLSVWAHACLILLMFLGRRIRMAVFGGVMGFGAVASVLLSVELQSGVFFDLRFTLIGASGLLGGPIAGLITGTIVAVYRLYVGGAGVAADSVGIVASMGMGLLGYRLLRGRSPSMLASLIFAMLGTTPMLLSVTGLPAQIPEPGLRGALLATLLLGAIATFLAIRALVFCQQRAEETMLFMAAADLAPDLAYIKDPRGRFLLANQALASFYGIGRALELRGKTDFDVVPAERAKVLFAEEQEVLRTGIPVFEREEMQVDEHGNERWFTSTKTPLYNARGDALGLVGVTRDITRQKASDRELIASRDQLAFILTEMSDGLGLFDSAGRIIYCNKQYRSMFPLTGKLRVPGAYLPEILRAAVEQGEQPDVPSDGVDRWINTVMSALQTGLDEEVHLFDGRWLHVRTKPLAGGNATVVVSDITLIKQAETDLRGLTQKLKLQATTDVLTGLPNRRAFDECLAKELARTKRSGQPLSLIMIDIDHFKAFNDIYGHLAGDGCLRRVGGALERTDRRPGDFIARYGGEEFCAILPATDEDNAHVFAERLRSAVRDIGQEHNGSEKGLVTISLGVASFAAEETDRTRSTLIARADEALYLAKGAGRDRVTGWTRRRSERWPAA